MDEQCLDGPTEQRVNAYPGLVWPSLDSIDDGYRLMILPSTKAEWKEAGALMVFMAFAAVAFVAIVAEFVL